MLLSPHLDGAKSSYTGNCCLPADGATATRSYKPTYAYATLFSGEPWTRVSRTSSGLAWLRTKASKKGKSHVNKTPGANIVRLSKDWGARAIAYSSFLRCCSRPADSAMSTISPSQMPTFAYATLLSGQARPGQAALAYAARCFA